jgi:hypothetical protein
MRDKIDSLESGGHGILGKAYAPKLEEQEEEPDLTTLKKINAKKIRMLEDEVKNKDTQLIDA